MLVMLVMLVMVVPYVSSLHHRYTVVRCNVPEKTE